MESIAFCCPLFLGVFADPLPSNKRPIVARVGSREMCSPSRCLAVGLCVTIYLSGVPVFRPIRLKSSS
jgi:hypothetical protein